MDERQIALLKEIASGNLLAWQRSGVIKSLRCYGAEDDAMCAECAKHDGAIIRIENAKIGEREIGEEMKPGSGMAKMGMERVF